MLNTIDTHTVAALNLFQQWLCSNTGRVYGVFANGTWASIASNLQNIHFFPLKNYRTHKKVTFRLVINRLMEKFAQILPCKMNHPNGNLIIMRVPCKIDEQLFAWLCIKSFFSFHFDMKVAFSAMVKLTNTCWHLAKKFFPVRIKSLWRVRIRMAIKLNGQFFCPFFTSVFFFGRWNIMKRAYESI